MKKPLLRRVLNRFLHSLARTLPGATTLRPMLHRWRGAKIGKNVFIADEVYLENEYPDAIEIQDGVQISLRAIFIAHTRGPGKIIIEKDAYIGPNTVIATASGRVLRIGEGAVIGAGVSVSSDVAAQMFIVNPTPAPVARALVPLSKAQTMEDFIRGLAPLLRPSGGKPKASAVATNGSNSQDSEQTSRAATRTN